MDRFSHYLSYFNRLGYPANSVISPVDLMAALETLCGSPYNEDIASQLLERIPNSSYSFLIANFIEVLIEAEDILNEKIQKSGSLIDDYSHQREIFKEKLYNMKVGETYNPLGVNLENTLSVEISEVLNLPKIDGQFFILVNCGAQRFKSKPFQGIGTNLRLNEVFNGKIERGTENIYLSLMAFGNMGEELLGQQMIPLGEITDQLKHDFSLVLLKENGMETPIRLNVYIQWIHSKVNYYEQIIENLTHEIENLQKDQKDYKLDLDWLLLPFKSSLGRFNPAQIHHYSSNQPLPINVPESLLISQKEGVFGMPNQGNEYENNLRKSKVLKQETELKESQFSDHHKETTKKELKKDYLLLATLGLTSLYGIFAVLSCYMRPNFVDLFIAFSFIFSLVTNFFEKWKLNTLIFFTIFSVFVDLPWLIIYTPNWWDQTYYIESNSDETGFLRLAIVMSYFTLVSKIFLIAFYWKLGSKVEKMNDNMSFFFKPPELARI